MIFVKSQLLQNDVRIYIIAVIISLRWKMFIYIFAKFWSKTLIALLNIIIYFIRRKNTLWWIMLLSLTVCSEMLFTAFKWSSSLISSWMNSRHSSMMTESQHSWSLMNEYNISNIINLASFSSSSLSSRLLLHQQ